AAGKAGAADFPRPELVTESDGSRAPRPLLSVPNFAAPASPAAAWRSPNPTNVTRSLPIPTREAAAPPSARSQRSRVPGGRRAAPARGRIAQRGGGGAGGAPMT